VHPRIIIVAAIERELSPLVAKWPRSELRTGGRRIVLFESDGMIAAVGGMGTIAARNAAEAAFARCGGEAGLVVSAGLCGALVPELRVGEVIRPAAVFDATDELTIAISGGERGVLLTSGSVASSELKRKMAAMYGAIAVDMEAYAVADVAQLHRVPFLAVKAISDELDFPMPPLGRFIQANGELRTGALAFYAALRPWLWPAFIRLGCNSTIASKNLCRELQVSIAAFRASERYNKETEASRNQGQSRE